MAHLDDEPPAPSIATERLDLRPFTSDDEEAMAAVFADAELLRFWGPPLDRDAVRQRIVRNAELNRVDGFARWAIVLRDGGKLVGDAGLTRTDVEGIEEIELGWVVRRDHGGRGIATEAAAAWRDHAFGPLGLVRIVSMIRRENAPSRRVAEKIGMGVEREARWNEVPHLVYALDRDDAMRPSYGARVRSLE
jgi:[ribosomal protein S5]-alanine N-acetyltransferase